MARPQKLTNWTIRKLEEAFVLGTSIREACYYANISKQTYYNWKKENTELFDHFELFRQAPILAARKTVVEALERDPNLAMRYLERKRRDEFGYTRSATIVCTDAILQAVLSHFEAPPA